MTTPGRKPKRLSDQAPPRADSLVGTVIDQFRISRQMQRGGGSVLVEAIQPSMDRLVALKIVPIHPRDANRTIARICHEARIAARARHPHVVPVFGWGHSSRFAYIAMELTPGSRTLRSWCIEERRRECIMGRRQNRTIRTDHAIRLILQLLRALDHCHAQGIVHGDIKLDNVLVDSGDHVRLADFGSASTTRDRTRPDGLAQFSGTHPYVSPERVRNEPNSLVYSCDVFASGVLLAVLCTRASFTEDEAEDGLRREGLTGPTMCRVIEPLPCWVRRAVLRATAADPSRRFATAREFERALIDGVAAAGSTPPDSSRPASRLGSLLMAGVWVLCSSTLAFFAGRMEVPAREGILAHDSGLRIAKITESPSPINREGPPLFRYSNPRLQIVQGVAHECFDVESSTDGGRQWSYVDTVLDSLH